MSLKIYNTLTREKETFETIIPDYVGMYVCGPTVYSDVHLGNCRTFISFDIIYRYLKYLGYKVRYVRNITDAGHLEGDRDEGDDKFAKKARLEQVEPMEIVQKYTVGFHQVMDLFNNMPPSIEPTATGHILEQIEMTKQIIANGYAYEVNGTIYFDVEKYNKEKPYGILTNRKLEDLLEGTRDLDGQDEKRGRLDFALWIKAKPEHLMQWPSPWGSGFPGWHIECSAMSEKYLGKQFDIHGGGMDLAATHHTNEIAQSEACYHTSPAKYWMHTNMLTVNGTRMSKSLGNGFLPGELFTGDHPLLEKAYSPMTVRFFMLQTHYRSTLDFSNEALQASEKGLKRLWDAYEALKNFSATNAAASDAELETKVLKLINGFDESMNDDFNTAKVVANMFELVPVINSIKEGIININVITGKTVELLQSKFKSYLEDVFGLKVESVTSDGKLPGVIQLLIDIRKEAKAKKDFATSDKIRNQLLELNIQLKDEKNGEVSWSVS
ncbi:MAG: cysteine--tRNA ligase [Bacteroidetes bacterium]|nr:cysteine--tRNA ligase [Bacteroidota bacterium]MBK9414205.1 cysteine--tRNA ligase [Bacteroidota bacterium]MBL0030760.1 cysteine--tRNA ligase [Bacteroidota bacterium]MBP6426177.1 cysteine--tRNA ligase [Bacteroidia bacterium]MBP6656367.1 cysteine--tRNA ligase [Bacteroidia bacterium]